MDSVVTGLDESYDFFLEDDDVAGNVCYLDRPNATRNDRSDRLQLRWALRQVRLLRMQLAGANLRKDQGLAEIAHELRNPLGAIRGAAYLLGRQDAGRAVRQKTQALIERQAVRMTRLIDNLLDVSRVGNGRMCLRRERLDLRNVVQQAIESVESNIGERDHRLAISLPETPVWLHADAGRLEQVFVNLLGNAAKYTDAGGTLEFNLQRECNQAIVCVRDSGIGIAPEMLPRIFDLFVQADGSASHSEGGLGIGLALVRSFVELHGGGVCAASRGLGQGSEFTVRLPLA